MSPTTFTVTAVLVLHGLLPAAAEVRQIRETDDASSIDLLQYPEARRDENSFSVMHGHKIADPYRWLEDVASAETEDFVERLNNISRPYLDRSAVQSAWREWERQVSERLPTNHTLLRKFRDHYYYEMNGALYRQKGYRGRKGEVFLDADALSRNGTALFFDLDRSVDGRILAATSVQSSGLSTVEFFNDNGHKLPDTINGSQIMGVGFLYNEGFFYSKYQQEDEYHSVYYHRMNSSCEEDVLVAERRDDPRQIANARITHDQRYLLIVWLPSNDLYYYDLGLSGKAIEDKLPFQVLSNLTGYYYVASDEDSLVFLTAVNATNMQVVRVNLTNARDHATNFETLIAEDPSHAISLVLPAGKDKLVVEYLRNGYNTYRVYGLRSGRLLATLPMPISVSNNMVSSVSTDDLFINAQTFVDPACEYRFDLSGPAPYPAELVTHATAQSLDLDRYLIKEVRYASRDGTMVPMFIVHARGLKLDGQNVVFLVGHKDPRQATRPTFFMGHLFFVERMGGVVAVPNGRGDGADTDDNVDDLRQRRRQNALDDFVAAANYLIAEGYTQAGRVVGFGVAGTATMVAVAAQQRPDLFGAVIAVSGVYDMLRLRQTAAGQTWTTEYGDPANETDFEYLYEHSPLHNVRLADRGHQQWPAIYLTANEGEAAFVHTLKYTAQLYHAIRQANNATQRNPLITLLRKPADGADDSLASIYAFIQLSLNISLTPDLNANEVVSSTGVVPTATERTSANP